MELEKSQPLVAKCMQCNEYPCNPSTQLCFYCKSGYSHKRVYLSSDSKQDEVQNDDDDDADKVLSSAEKTTTITVNDPAILRAISTSPPPSLKRKRSDMQVNETGTESESNILLLGELMQQIQLIRRQTDHLEQLWIQLMKKQKHE